MQTPPWECVAGERAPRARDKYKAEDLVPSVRGRAFLHLIGKSAERD